jgi:hypothetical protein
MTQGDAGRLIHEVETQNPQTVEDVLAKLKDTIFNINKTTNNTVCSTGKLEISMVNCKNHDDSIKSHGDDSTLPEGVCYLYKQVSPENCIDFLFEKLDELTDEQKRTLNSLKYIVMIRTFSIWGYLLINNNYNYLSRLSKIIEVKFSEDDVVYIKKIMNKINSSEAEAIYKITNIINFLKTLPVDVLEKLPIDVLKNIPSNVLEKLPIEVLKTLPVEVLKTLPVDVLKNLPIKILKTLPSNILFKLPKKTFDALSKNDFLSKTKMKARTLGAVKTLLGYGGTKKRRASKRRKNNKRSRRIR